MLQKLNKILSKNEVIIYEDLLSHGISKATDIAKRTELARNRIYDALDRLISKNLVFLEKGQVKHYLPANPKQLKEYLAKLAIENKKTLDEINALIPSFTKKYESHKIPMPYFTYSHGFKEILKEIRKEIRNTKKFVYIFARRMTFFDDFKLISAYNHLVSKGIDVRIITADNKKTKEIVKKIKAKSKFITEDSIIERTMIIKDNSFAISLYGKHEEIRLKTESSELIDAFKSIFLLTWKLAK